MAQDKFENMEGHIGSGVTRGGAAEATIVQRCIYGDFHAQNFGVSKRLRVKVLDFERKDAHCFDERQMASSSSSPTTAAAVAAATNENNAIFYGSAVKCNDKNDCLAHFARKKLMFGRVKKKEEKKKKEKKKN